MVASQGAYGVPDRTFTDLIWETLILVDVALYCHGLQTTCPKAAQQAVSLNVRLADRIRFIMAGVINLRTGNVSLS